MAGRMSLRLIVVWEVFCALFRAINEKLCNTPPVARIKPNRADTASTMMWCAGSRRRTGRGRDMAGRTRHQLIVVWEVFCALFRASAEQ